MTVEIVMMLHQNFSDGLSDGDELFMATGIQQGYVRSWLGHDSVTVDTTPYNKVQHESTEILDTSRKL